MSKKNSTEKQEMKPEPELLLATTEVEPAVRLNYAEWLMLRKHASITSALLCGEVKTVVPVLLQKGLLSEDLKLTERGAKALRDYRS